MSQGAITTSDDAEASQRLKLLVLSLKKKYGESVAQAYNLEAKCKELATENTSLKQTQSALSQKFNQTLVELHSLQEERSKLINEHSSSSTKASDADHEVKALRDQHSHLLTLLHTHEEEAKKAIDELQAVKLKETQLERVIQFLRKRSEEAHLESNQLTQELSHAQEQTHSLTDELGKSTRLVKELQESLHQHQETTKEEKEELLALKEQLKTLGQEFGSLTKQNQALTLDCSSLKEELHEQNTRYDTLTKEHIFLKQSMMRSVDETHQELLKAKEIHEIAQKESLAAFTAKEELLTSEISLLKEEVLRLQKRDEEAQAVWSMKDAIDLERKNFTRSIDEIKGQNQQLIADKEEIEQRFKTAQQHLAKKVRETSVAQERIESEKVKSLELQNQLNVAQIKILELKNSLEMESEHQKRALARESELLKNAESQLARLEEKYFQMHEKWKEAETEVRDLKKVEEKWREAEKLFSKMGHFAPKPHSKESPKEPIGEVKRDVPREPVKEVIHEQPNLFEEAKGTPSRYKESFL